MKVREDFSLLLSLYDCGKSFKNFSANKLSLFFFQGSELQGFECYVKRSLWSGGNLTRRRDIFQNQVVCDFLICCLFVDAEQASCHQLSFCFRIFVSVVQKSFYPFNSLLPRGD